MSAVCFVQALSVQRPRGRQTEYMTSLETRAPMTADSSRALCTRPVSAPLACLPPSSVISPSSPNRRQQTMALDEAINILAVLTPIAKAVPVLALPWRARSKR
jgi:hypothetical protein